MAQQVKLMGVVYNDVPAVRLPDNNNVMHRFDDCSVVTAVASDVTQGKIFVDSSGNITMGTGSGGGVDGDNLAYGTVGAIVGTAIVGTAIAS